MGKKHFTEEQIAYALRQQEAGTPVVELPSGGLANATRVPFYEGIGNTMTSSSEGVATQRLVPSEESKWVRQAAGGIERLDPDAPPMLNTGIRLKIRGLQIPGNATLAYWV